LKESVHISTSPLADLSLSPRSSRTERLRVSVAAGVLIFLMAVAPAPAMIFYSTADTSYNTTAPTGSLANSGWQWTGYWIGFQGVPVSPHHFLAARHIGGAVGDVFTLNGVDYTTVAFQDDTVSDLRLWQVKETFPSWAPLYRASDEVGKSLVVMGRGLTRGAELRVGGVLNGWYWGNGDGKLRWGQNTVSAAVDGGSYWGELLYATFDQSGGVNEAHLATYDSSGPVFINDGSEWKLAGVAAAVDGPFNTTDTGNGFEAAIFDARGLYYTDTPPDNWVLISGPSPVPSGLYATRVSVRAGWIDSVTAVDDSNDVPLLEGPGLVAFVVLLAGTGAFFLRRFPGASRGLSR
jgi:hypothetical protein